MTYCFHLAYETVKGHLTSFVDFDFKNWKDAVTPLSYFNHEVISEFDKKTCINGKYRYSIIEALLNLNGYVGYLVRR